jgi:hypothetical protein
MRFWKPLQCFSLILICYAGYAAAEDSHGVSVRSAHIGFLHPEGVDVAGYSMEEEFADEIYFFVTFGYPALAATGLTYYEQYGGNGLTATAGVGLGFVLYTSLGYQWQIGQQHFLKAGAGWAAGIAYEGAFPVLSYEYRLAR